jgi:hypothetical protein
MNEKKLLHYGFNIEDYITDNIVNEAKENDINFCNELYNTINKYSSSLTQYADELIRITYTAKKYIRVCKEVDDNYISITKPYHKDLANLEEFFLLFEGNDFSIQEIVLKSQNGVVKLKSSILVESISTLLLNILNDSQDITRRKSPQIKILSSRMKARNTVNFMRKVYATELLTTYPTN